MYNLSSQQKPQNNTKTRRSFSPPPAVTALLLFLVALVPRLFGLRRFLTTDESYFIYSAGSNVLREFLAGNLRGTYWHFYPGVTLSWLENIGIGSQYLLHRLLGRPVARQEFELALG